MQALSIERFVGQVSGNYRVESFLGRGRLNAVYLAQNLASRRIDALTLYLPPEQFSIETRNRFVARFLKEAATVSTLRHMHILPIFEYGEWSGYPYLVTPYMTNGSLADILKQQGRCEHTYVLEVLEQIAAGLGYAHSNGLIHGTLKPANIIVNNDKSIQVAGFGLRSMLQAQGIITSDLPYVHLLSIANTFLAATEYLAPEVIQGQAVDARSDIYALGAILFELLSGQTPFMGASPLETAQQHIQSSAPSLRSLCPEVPVALESVVNQALERDPTRRFQHVDDLVEAFMQVSHGATGYMQRVSPSNEVRRADDALFSPYSGDLSAENMPRNWQLVPPIMTGQMPAINLPVRPAARLPEAQPIESTGSWQLRPPILTGQMPVARVPAPPAHQPEHPAAPADTGNWQLVPPIVTGQLPAIKSVLEPKALPAPQPPAHDEPKVTPPKSDAGSMKPFDWWSMPGQVNEAALEQLSASQKLPQGVIEPKSSHSPEHEHVAELVDWNSEPIQALPNAAKKAKARKVNRRQAVAVLAGVGVIAAGATLATKMNLLRLAGIGNNAPLATQPAKQQRNGPAAQPATGQQNKSNGTSTQNPQKSATKAPTNTTTTGSNQAMPAQTAGHTGTVIGATNMAVNSSMPFTNPADGKSSLLIHLPDGSFAAYERACTHEGVSVNYDPNTHTLVCPAHGAIFDPAKGGSIIQGPATKPIAKVAVRVNADGTVTTG